MIQVQFTLAKHGISYLVQLFDSAFRGQCTKWAGICVHGLLWETCLPF
jgi:hypothetical protein